MKRIFSFSPQLTDERDSVFQWSVPKKELPAMVDLRSVMPKVYDQGSLGSCTSNAIAALVEVKSKIIMPSRLFLYFNERVVINTINEDSGANLRDGFKSVKKQGICEEDMCPYIIEKYTEKPLHTAYQNAIEYTATQYTAIPQTENSLKTALVAGLPIAFGFMVKESLMNVGEDGIYKPKGQVLGGHAVAIVGYKDATKTFIVRNSWGGNWGDKGYFTMSYKDVLNPKVSTDFWVIQGMSK